ncbi:uncharacterized protein J7T54_007659 [Emericellopsis cladophorae]|uniref:Uncharacterized protein n=1 Tax=Emericellopsis cladophorae TaxID=2686198 RepID=A0A9P9XUJ6_9HYPO|nr:uncharacterized protein J7T54_007659 [Emericellopsis cladophorae]KAI6778051.1 hypothetical protein J7T54_007659 [Emericellopsis cladophorae]
MQDPAQQPRRRWSYTSKATCGLIKPSADAPIPKASTSSPTRPVQTQQRNVVTPSDSTQPRALRNQPNSTTKMPSTMPQRKPSLRERFWTVGAANSAVEKDREQRRRAYVPRQAASGFEKTASPLKRESEYITAASSRRRSPGDDEYQALVRKEEARDLAEQLYGEKRPGSNPAGVRRRPSKVVRMIAEYVKPPREGD